MRLLLPREESKEAVTMSVTGSYRRILYTAQDKDLPSVYSSSG